LFESRVHSTISSSSVTVSHGAHLRHQFRTEVCGFLDAASQA
jgi:hypothetical protein